MRNTDPVCSLLVHLYSRSIYNRHQIIDRSLLDEIGSPNSREKVCRLVHPLGLKGGLDLFYAVLVPFDWIHVEGVIELLSHCDDGASRIVPRS